MRDYFSFLGFTFIALLLFGILNNFHLSQEQQHPGSFLEKISFLLMFPFGLCSLPALILSLPILKIYTRLLESQFKAEADKKCNYFLSLSERQLATSEKKVADLEKRVADLDDQLLYAELDFRKIGYESGYTSGYKSGYCRGHRDGSEYTMSTLLCPDDQRHSIRLDALKSCNNYIDNWKYDM